MNLEEHFQVEFSVWDKIERGILDRNKRAHEENFNKNVDETLDYFPLESTVQNMSISTVAHQKLRQTDQDFFVLKKVWKKDIGTEKGYSLSKRESKVKIRDFVL